MIGLENKDPWLPIASIFDHHLFCLPAVSTRVQLQTIESTHPRWGWRGFIYSHWLAYKFIGRIGGAGSRLSFLEQELRQLCCESELTGSGRIKLLTKSLKYTNIDGMVHTLRKLISGMNRGREVSKGDCERVAQEVGGNPGNMGPRKPRKEFQGKGMENRI